MNRRVSLNILLWLLLAAVLVANALTSHISSSEFWPITLSKQLWYGTNQEISVFFKPVFHALLSILHLVPLTNTEHILLSRSLFGLLGLGSIFLFVKWLQNIKLIAAEKKSEIFVLFVLLSSPLFFSQIVKVRSDNLSLFLSLLFLVLASAAPPPWKPSRFLLLIMIHYMLLGTTPRAAFHSLIVISSLIPMYWDRIFKKEARLQVFLTLLAPPASFILISFPFIPLNGHHLWHYFRESFSASGKSIEHVLLWVQKEFVLQFFIWISFLYSLFKPLKNRFVLLLPFGVSLFVFAIADLKTPYLLSSIFPFLLMPFLALVYRIEAKTKILVALSVSILSGFFLTTRITDWWTSNQKELAVIGQISKVLDENPHIHFFDGLGILPRSQQFIVYLGPNDEIALNAAILTLKQKRPELVLYTSRFQLLGPEMTTYLLDHYEPLAANLYLRKGVQIKAEKFEFEIPPIFLFSLYPLVPSENQ